MVSRIASMVASRRTAASLRVTKCSGVLCRTKIRLQIVGGIVVEPQINGGELRFQNALLGEQSQRGPLHAVGWTDQHLTFTFEVGAGDAAVDALRKGDRPVVEPQMNVLPIDRRFADLVDALRVEPHAAQRAIERECRDRKSEAASARAEAE